MHSLDVPSVRRRLGANVRTLRIAEVEPDIQGARHLLAENTQRLRHTVGLTQAMAAERAGLDPRQWQKVEYEETNATLETLARVAAALDTTIRELFKPLRQR